jgi:hypothetical protein
MYVCTDPSFKEITQLSMQECMIRRLGKVRSYLFGILLRTPSWTRDWLEYF